MIGYFLVLALTVIFLFNLLGFFSINKN